MGSIFTSFISIDCIPSRYKFEKVREMIIHLFVECAIESTTLHAAHLFNLSK